MLAKQEKVETIRREEKKRFSIRQWELQNELNKKKGRPTIKLEEEEGDLVREYYSNMAY